AVESRRGFLISRAWIQAVAIVIIFGFFVLGLLAYETYTGKPPIPRRVTGPDGLVLFTATDILAGQGVFLRNGLMEYGSIFGHGAYLGPDFTADYLHRAALIVLAAYGGETDRARAQTIADFTTNRYDSNTDTLTFTAADVRAFDALQRYYGEFFGNPTTKFGLRPLAITDAQQIHELTAFFSWSAWVSAARRPGLAYSYTNNWPPEPLVDNHATADAVVWSVLSLIALLGGIGLLMAAFGRWNFLGWHGREQMTISFRPPDQSVLAYLLLGALAIVVFGSLAGEFAGIEGLIRGGWSWFGNQGFEYLDLGRFWQVLLTIGLLFWVIILYRGLRGMLRTDHAGNMPWLFFFSALSIPAFYGVGLLARPASHFTATDFWRFWVVHLWVEDFLELFTTIMVAYIFVLLGVVHERVALTMIYLDILLYSAGGVIGTMHHVYFSGEPSIHMALGAFFSAAEVIPLTFLTVEAWSFLQLGAAQETKSVTKFPHYWAVLFLASV